MTQPDVTAGYPEPMKEAARQALTTMDPYESPVVQSFPLPLRAWVQPAIARNVKCAVESIRPRQQHQFDVMIGTAKGRAAMARVVTLVSELVKAWCSVVGVRTGTEEPRHSVEQVTHGLEIRRYGPRIAAETTISADQEAARNAGFRRLAGYIFGANQGRAKIAMTAPVTEYDQSMYPAPEPLRRGGQVLCFRFNGIRQLHDSTTLLEKVSSWVGTRLN